MEYPKTENLYASNNVNGPDHERGPQYGFRLPSFGQIRHWLVTEKVDGMNMRVRFQPYGWSDEPSAPDLAFLGRTDRASIPGDLLAHMSATFTVEKMLAAFDYGEYEEGADDRYAWQHSVVLYGEGFGPGIQKAGVAYGGEKRFILFDVLVDEKWWLKWNDITDVAAKLGIPTVPVLADGVDIVAIEGIVAARCSQLLDDPTHVEGVVARTDPYLFDGRGRRVMFKHKVKS